MITEDIRLTAHFEQFVEEQIKTGQYENVSEVFRAGLRLLEAQEQERMLKLDCLRQAAKEGFEQLDRGEGIKVPPGGSDKFLDDCVAEANTNS